MDTTQSLLDPSPFSSSDYNSIECFKKEQTISRDHLEEIAKIYVRNEMHHNYGVGILHRHVDIPEECVMVHSLCDTVDVCYSDTVAICRAVHARDLDHQNVMPHSFLLNSNGLFQAYEYDSMKLQRSPPTERFLHQLRHFLVNHQLTKMVAILPEDGRRNSVELLLPDNQGMAYEEVNSFGSSAITGWKFCKDLDGKIQCIEKHGCDPQEDGVHKVV